MNNDNNWLPKGWQEVYPGEFDYLQEIGLLPSAYGEHEIERARNYLKDLTPEQIEQCRIQQDKAEIDEAIHWLFYEAGRAKRKAGEQ